MQDSTNYCIKLKAFYFAPLQIVLIKDIIVYSVRFKSLKIIDKTFAFFEMEYEIQMKEYLEQLLYKNIDSKL